MTLSFLPFSLFKPPNTFFLHTLCQLMIWLPISIGVGGGDGHSTRRECPISHHCIFSLTEPASLCTSETPAPTSMPFGSLAHEPFFQIQGHQHSQEASLSWRLELQFHRNFRSPSKLTRSFRLPDLTWLIILTSLKLPCSLIWIPYSPGFPTYWMFSLQITELLKLGHPRVQSFFHMHTSPWWSSPVSWP